MKQKIIDFHQDKEKHWVADLECGHKQHVRHDPPLVERLWVLSEEGRLNRLGQNLNCVVCDESGEKIVRATLAEYKKLMCAAYEAGGQSGLCAEGRWELALDSSATIDIKKVLQAALK